jgi:hypothetical protein
VRVSAALSSPDNLWISACPLVVFADTQVVQSSSCCLSRRIWSFASATLARDPALGPGRWVPPIALETGPSDIPSASSADGHQPTDPVAVFVSETVPRTSKPATPILARTARRTRWSHANITDVASLKAQAARSAQSSDLKPLSQSPGPAATTQQPSFLKARPPPAPTSVLL